MGKRIKIGIVYSYDENWIGGTYYYQNLIQSLKLLPEEQKPHLVILSNNSISFNSIKELDYPFITYKVLYKKTSFAERCFSKLIELIIKKKRGAKKINCGIDVLFHPSEIEIPNSIKKHLYWIPDFQEIYMPHFFSKEYLDFRKKKQQEILSVNDHILFSSNDACMDFEKLYPAAETNKYVVNFCVFHPNYFNIKIEDLLKKYQLDDIPYFFSPNQFWKHKNHIVVLKAIKKMRDLYDFNFQILFSGKEFDHRNPEYFNDIKQFVIDNKLEKFIKFLGFIDRSEQLCFMNNALAVIQPSLFEGWSSVIEDAKAMNQNVIASSLSVHVEQLENQGYYFNPQDDDELMNRIIYFIENSVKKPEFNYNEKRHLFGEKFMKAILHITK
ncbi:glycosyltransferase family 4 protein [Flavobacterium defluvii]|uniref:Glycosyltransferase involved in cell wall bisynthesis n=1 Tax=Flavobacterium defluvii TaxID=370979 RepID=A0A1M5NW08_9FLAO|nr:glycosyltransferase family 1 protein [Flavobacterium defluvii]SHG93163.1 Glycosyltransferase involved in cell wall bisynthesis [Flavobacterium defluvii]